MQSHENGNATTPPATSPAAASPSAAPTPDELELEQLQAEEDERQKLRSAERDAQKLTRLRLIKRFEAELGPRGREFVIVGLLNVGEGFVVLKRPTAVAHKKFMSAWEKAKDKGRPMEEADVKDYVKPCVAHPSKDDYIRIANERAAVPMMCAGKMIEMVTADEEEDQGK
jgi:hypothetical protein